MMWRSVALSTCLLVTPIVGFSVKGHRKLSGSSTSPHRLHASVVEPVSTTTTGESTLNQLAKLTTLSIDSGDLDAVAKFSKTGLIQDATTCPFYVSEAAQKGDSRYQDMVYDAIQYTKIQLGGGDVDVTDPDALLNMAMDKLAVNLGAKLLEMIPGNVHSEVDIRQSYHTEASVERARRLIRMYEEMGIERNRVVIKLAGTWEGIQAARILEKEGIRTNITLIFSFLQVAAAAQAGCFVVSPFPGRVLDWYKSKSGRDSYLPQADPGVLLTKRMYSYLRHYGYDTICMPASWRSSRTATGRANGEDDNNSKDDIELDQVLALAGIDQMTLPVHILERLATNKQSVVKQVDATADAATCCDPDLTLTREAWDTYIISDPCVVEKFEDGLRLFKVETENLRKVLMDQW